MSKDHLTPAEELVSTILRDDFHQDVRRDIVAAVAMKVVGATTLGPRRIPAKPSKAVNGAIVDAT